MCQIAHTSQCIGELTTVLVTTSRVVLSYTSMSEGYCSIQCVGLNLLLRLRFFGEYPAMDVCPLLPETCL